MNLPNRQSFAIATALSLTVFTLSAIVAPSGVYGEESPEEIAIKRIESIRSSRVGGIEAKLKSKTKKISDNERAKLLKELAVAKKEIPSWNLILGGESKLGDYGSTTVTIYKIIDKTTAIVQSTNNGPKAKYVVDRIDTTKYADDSRVTLSNYFVSGKRMTDFGTLFTLSPLKDSKK